MERLLDQNVTMVAAFPGTRSWLASGAKEGTVCFGSLDEATVTSLTYGGSKSFGYTVIAACGIDASTVVMTDGVSVTRLTRRDGAKALTQEKRWELPGELGWNAGLAVSKSGERIVVASDLRLALFGDETRVLSAEGGFEERFRCPAFSSDDATILVGRGDGRIELRDARTLDVKKTFPGSGAAVLAVCVLDDARAAVATDDARTVILDLGSGERTELDLGRMKTSGLHLRNDGALIVVGLSRRVTIFEGTRCVREGDFSEQLGDRYIQASALAGDTLLLACEAKGLWSVALSSLAVEAARPSLPAPPDQIRAATTAMTEVMLLHGAIAAKQDITALVAKLLAHDDEIVRREVFMALATSDLPLPEAQRHLASPIARVRYYAADHYGQLHARFVDRASELEPVLHDADTSVVGAAAWALGRLGDRKAVPWLAPLLRHMETSVRATAANALLALRGGMDALAAAIGDGAGELSWSAVSARWPKFTPALVAPTSADLVSRIAAGMRLDAILSELGVLASPAFLSAHGETEHRANLRANISVIQLVSVLSLPQRWAVTFDGTTLTLTTHAEAGAYWAKALSTAN